MTRKTAGIRLWSGIVIFLSGLSLCALQAANLIIPESKSDLPRTGIVGYDYHVYSASEYSAEMENVRQTFWKTGDRWQAATRINEVVGLALRHDGSAQIHLSENWIQWVCGKFYQPLSLPLLSNQILKRHSGICSDACRVDFLELQKLDIPSRFVGLDGHVVLEVRIDSSQLAPEWRMLDPDFGVVSLSSVEKISADADGTNRDFGPAWKQLAQELQDRGFSAAQIENYRQIIASSVDNEAIEVDHLLNPRLYYFAAITCWLSPISAIMLSLLGAALVRSN